MNISFLKKQEIKSLKYVILVKICFYISSIETDNNTFQYFFYQNMFDMTKMSKME